jgi:sarcosine oxidase subunit beta
MIMGRAKNTAEVVIVGGGIMGICTAYYLAQRGQTDVLLFEKDLLAQASTGLSVGGIRQQFTLPANIRLTQETLRSLKRFPQELGAEIEFHRVGYLFLARKESTWEDFTSALPTQCEYSVPVEALSPREIKQRWPYLEVNDLRGGTFGPEDGYTDPYSVAMAFAGKARKLGVRIKEKTEVIDIRVEKGHVSGVETTEGTFHTRTVVNTAGPWGGDVAKMAGLSIPVLPFRRQVFVTKAFKHIPDHIPMIIDQDTLFYFRGEKPGILMGMSDMEESSSFNTHVDWGFLEKVIEAAVHRAPILKKARILRGWGGLYAITPDENAIIGEAEDPRRFFCAVGFSGHGFQHGPAVGKVLSDLILDGKTGFDLNPFTFNRFRTKKVTQEKRIV